jgi:hypothetical protein
MPAAASSSRQQQQQQQAGMIAENKIQNRRKTKRFR